MKINDNNLLCKRFMRRVYFIWFMKKVAPFVLMELAFFISSIYLINYSVSLDKVLLYMSQILAVNSLDPIVWTGFVFHVFFKTHLIVQASVIGALAMAILILRSVVMSMAHLAWAKEETKLATRVVI